MSRPFLKGLLFGVAFFSFVAAACAQHPKLDPYPASAKSTTNVALVGVIWLPTLKDANAACAAQIGADPTTTRIYACYNSDSHIIYTVEPTSFNDHFGLEVLGHEFWHALGLPSIRILNK
jgi:hypothetical protein